MPVYNLETIDGAAIDPDNGDLVLLIEDRLAWGDEQMHLGIIEAKLNSYFQFVSSGQHRDLYPDAGERKLRIDCLCEQQPPASIDWFVRNAQEAASLLDIEFSIKTMPPAGDADEAQ